MDGSVSEKARVGSLSAQAHAASPLLPSDACKTQHQQTHGRVQPRAASRKRLHLREVTCSAVSCLGKMRVICQWVSPTASALPVSQGCGIGQEPGGDCRWLVGGHGGGRSPHQSHGVVTRVQRATTVKGICECVCSGEPTARGPVGASAAKRPDEGSRVGRVRISVNGRRARLTDGTCSRRHCAAGVLGWPAPSVSRACGQVFDGQ